MPMIVSGGSRSIGRRGYYAEGPRVEFPPDFRHHGAGGETLEVSRGRAPLAVERRDGREGRVRREPVAPLVRGVARGVPRGPAPPGPLVRAVPQGRPRPLRLRGAGYAGRAGAALEGVRPAVRSGRPGAPRRGTGGGPGRALPRARHVRAVGTRRQARAPARPERLGEVVDRRRARPRDGGLLPHARGGALSHPLGVSLGAEAQGG